MTALAGARIRHTVVFSLRHAAGSTAESDFLDAVRALAAIPGVEEFELCAEVSSKNDYRFGISMEFADAAAYGAYNVHPDHVSFVQNRWLKETVRFQETDYGALDPKASA